MRYFLALAAITIAAAGSIEVALAQRYGLLRLRSWSEAQAFIECQGPGDAHRLDADNDDIACETLR